MGLGGKFTRVESRYIFTRRVSVDHADDMRLEKTSIIRVLHDEPEKRLARLLFHVAAGKFLGAPWGRQAARHFICPIAHGAWTEPCGLFSSSMARVHGLDRGLHVQEPLTGLFG